MTVHIYIWNEKFSVGNEEVDSQHRSLFNAIRELQLAFYDSISDEFILAKVDGLKKYVLEHFALELSLFEPYKHRLPMYDEHVLQHEKFVQAVDGFVQRFVNEKEDIAEDLYDFLGSWLNAHIVGMDKVTFLAVEKLKSEEK